MSLKKRLPVPTSSRRLALALFTVCGLVASTAGATDYYWRGNGGTNYWSATALWKTNENGTGTSPSSITSADTFIVTNVTGSMGTNPTTTGTNLFAGGTLVLANGQISVKATGSGLAQVTNFIATGGGIIVAAEAANVVHNLRLDSFENQSGMTRLSASSNANNRTLNLSIGTLTGSGGFTADANSGSTRPIKISIENAAGYTGDLGFANGLVDFDSAIDSGGSLTLTGSSVLVLDQSVSFTAVTINGTPLTAGTHSFESLNTAFDSFFADGGSGSITVAAVPEPSATAALAGSALLGFATLRRRR